MSIYPFEPLMDRIITNEEQIVYDRTKWQFTVISKNSVQLPEEQAITLGQMKALQIILSPSFCDTKPIPYAMDLKSALCLYRNITLFNKTWAPSNEPICLQIKISISDHKKVEHIFHFLNKCNDFFNNSHSLSLILKFVNVCNPTLLPDDDKGRLINCISLLFEKRTGDRLNKKTEFKVLTHFLAENATDLLKIRASSLGLYILSSCINLTPSDLDDLDRIESNIKDPIASELFCSYKQGESSGIKQLRDCQALATAVALRSFCSLPRDLIGIISAYIGGSTIVRHQISKTEKESPPL